MKPIINLSLIIALLSTLFSCRGDIYIQLSESTNVQPPKVSSVAGFYLLNEGNMGSNKATLDYFDETAGVYHSNIYAETNPTAIKELGDVGNDLEIYGSRLYAVINCSHKVEVMNASDATRIAQVDIPNCRYAIGHGRHLYVSSYVAPAQIDPHAPRGAVYKVDTLTLDIVDIVEVGYQPEEMAIANGRLYVANSGGYRKPNYDTTVSVINLSDFTVENSIEVAINLHRVKADSHGRIFVSSRGDNNATPSRLFVIDSTLGIVTNEIDIPVSDLWIKGDSAYIYSVATNEMSGKSTITYGILDLNLLELVNDNIITDGTDVNIKKPTGIAVHPLTGDIYIADGRNYVSSGRLHCYSSDGTLKWSQTTGEIPAHFAFLIK